MSSSSVGEGEQNEGGQNDRKVDIEKVIGKALILFNETRYHPHGDKIFWTQHLQ